MTSVNFLTDSNGIYGFEISGHSSKNSGDTAGKIICSAVSSAAYMTANTITEIIGDKAEVTVSDAEMLFSVKNPSPASRQVLLGLKLHLTELSGQYSNNIKINGGANHVKD